jgi:hypothetical protein
LLHYFNNLFTGNYHLSDYKRSSIIIYKVLKDSNNQDIFKNEIIALHDSKLQYEGNSSKLRIYLLKEFLGKYNDDKTKINKILKPYYASYGYTFASNKEISKPYNTDKIFVNLKEDYELSIFDINIISLLYGVNFIIFTLQNKDMINFLDVNKEHNNNPQINIRKVFMNKDQINSKYLILNHRFLISSDESNNHLSHVTIDDNSLIEYRNLPIKLREALGI